jgi:DNA polymerase V
VVDTSITPRTGHIVLADVDGEYTLKKIDFKLMRLIPANPAFEPITLQEGMELRIVGVVTSIIINPYLPFVNS